LIQNFYFSFVFLSKVVRRNHCFIDNEHDTESESSLNSPKEKNKGNLVPVNLSPMNNNNISPSSPESDLDVDDSPTEDSLPKNLSIKKRERTKSPCNNNSNFNNNIGFLSYSESFYRQSQRILGNQRSPVDVLMR
jgi:hypothetical protein